MFEFILNQLRSIIKQSQSELELKLLKEIRESEAQLRTDIAYLRLDLKRNAVAKTFGNIKASAYKVPAKSWRY